MAIYSLNLRSIGRSTQKTPYTAAAALRYIGRKTASTVMVGEHVPTCSPGDTKAAQAWFRAQENADRRNARVADRIIIALPLELDHTAQVGAVNEFMHQLGRGRVPWVGGLHNGPHDAHNPHAHLLVRDRDITTGKRVIGLSEKDAVLRVRTLWATVCNEALRSAGVAARIDHRSNKERGLDRIPGAHVGQKLPHMATPPEEENRMTINRKISAANAAMDSARTLRQDVHDMVVDIAHSLAEERAARLIAEAELEIERKRRKEIEADAEKARSAATETIRQMQDFVDEARNYLRALYTRVAPSALKPNWLDDRAWHVFVSIMRFGPPRPASGGIQRGRASPLPEIKRRTQDDAEER